MSWVQQPTVSAATSAPANPLQPPQQQQHQFTPDTRVPYQQQLQQQLQHLPQQQQHGSAFASKTALSQMPAPPASLPNAALNKLNTHLQNHMPQSTATHFNPPPPPSQISQYKTQQQQLPQQVSQQQQFNTWQQQQNYQQHFNSTMQPAAANANNWLQQQSSTVAQSTQNVAYPQSTNNWQTQQTQPHSPGYENYFAQNQNQNKQHEESQLQNYQQNDLNATVNQQPTATQQQVQQPQQQYNYNDFYDNSNNSANNNVNTSNANNKSNDAWGDWGDWNDNSVLSSNNDSRERANTDQTPQQPAPINTNVIVDSFNTQNNANSNDTWQWNIQENAVTAAAPQQAPAVLAAPQASAVNQALLSKQTNLPQQPLGLQQLNANQPAINQQQHKTADFAVVTSKAATTISTVKPPNTLPLNAFKNEMATENNVPTTTTTNIPNSVYVSQAKPVTRPPRQFASPPSGNTPIESPEISLLLPQPPQAFQNEATPLQSETVEAPKPAVAMPPPPPNASSATNTAVALNPFKRAGAVKHHRAELLPASTVNTLGVPPPPSDFANPLTTTSATATHLEPDNSEILHENQEVIEPPPPAFSTGSAFVPVSSEQASVAPTPPVGSVALLNAERNQYMQTSQLSEHQDDEYNIEIDSLPPPGLSRLVLGEPELESANQRLVTGTEEPTAVGNLALASLNMEERHADGEDTSADQMPNIMTTLGGLAPRGAGNIGAANIAADRNLYEVPGESDINNDRRVVTGVETTNETLTIAAQVAQVRSDQREVELDGENLEDEQQPPVSNSATVPSRNEPPVEGAAANSEKTTTQTVTETVESRHYDKHHSKSSTGRSQSNASTGNESDFELIEHQQPQQQHQLSQRHKSARSTAQSRHVDSERRVKTKQRSVERSFGSEEASVEYSTDQEQREKRRGYREGSARSDHGVDDRREHERERQRKRDKRENLSGAEREREHDRHYKSSGANVSSRNDYSRRSTRGHGTKDPQREPRSERDYENSHRRSNRHEKDISRSERADDGRDVRDRRGAPVRRGERDTRGDYNTIERQRRRGDRNHVRDYDDYRKQSSRNARDSDVEKEQQRLPRNAGNNQLPDPRYDPHMMYGYPNPTQYDPYKYYYETMARTNPQAYQEWYKKYYEQQKQLMAAMSSSQHQAAGNVAATADNLSANATVGAGSSSLAATDGRESVHSGRSSAHNEKDRYTQAYISQANQYHQRHYQQNVQFHHSQQQKEQLQQHHHHQQQQQQHLNRSLNAAAAAVFHSQNFVINSTFLGDAASVASFGSYSRGGRLSAAHSVDNLSSISSSAFKAISGHYLGNAVGCAKYSSLERYADLRSGQLSLRDAESIALEPHRSTPLQFASLHTLVSMSTGIMVTIKPRVSSKGHLNNIAKIQRLGINDASKQLYQSFPGPLVRGLTHKKTIIDFCEEQIRLGPNETTIYARQLTPRSVEKYRASYTLMWNLLILLLRQNGVVVGTDIAELLLKNQQLFPYQASNGSQSSSHGRLQSLSDDETSENSFDVTESKSVVEGEQEGSAEANKEENKNNESAADSVPTSTTAPLSEAEVTEKFRNYLLYGNVNEALDWATDNNLWGHALFLASKVDRRLHANVMMKFANKLSLNDPLQTLYQLMSGRSPSSVTSVQDEKWGDWRPHLSMILSNTSLKPELDRKAITTLGDSLFNRGDLYAAHFCYIMSQVSFGRYQESAVHETSLQQNLPKLVLLGSSHYKNFRDFASNEAIMMTEIYEYACSLNDEKFSLVQFQPYKYLLATRLLDYGFSLKSLMYMEQISVHIARDPSRYDASFINKVFEIADRLKYFDPVLEKTLDDQQQTNSESTSNTDLPNAMPQSFEEQKWLQTLRTIALQYKLDYPVPTASYPSHDYTQQQQNEQQQQDSNYSQNQINQEFAELNKQFSELNSQYAANNEQQATTFYNPDTMQQQSATNLNAGNQQSQDYNQYPAQTMYGNYGSPVQEQNQIAASGTGASAETASTDPYANYVAQQQQSSQYYDPNSQQQPAYDAYAQQNAAGYSDYWGQQQQQQIGDENARPTISMPKSKTYDSDDENQRKQQQQFAQQKAANAPNQAKKGANGIAATQQSKNANKSSQQTNQNSGWFGGIWNKLSLKPKNQMILPDDKNPTIVWDAEKKRWINTDGDETSEESFKPPPKMSDIMQQQQQQPMPPQQLMPQHQQEQQQQPQHQQPQFQMQQPPQQPQVAEAINQLQPMTVPLAASSPLTNYSAQTPTATVAPAPATASAVAANTVPKQPSLQSNMFKMQRNRTLKNAYVDVFNPSGAPMSKAAENVLAPALPPAAVPQSGFFVPDASATGEAYQQQQPQQAETPQFYNPSQFAGGGY